MIKNFTLKRGFTLIELMVVIAIIAILTAIITSNFAQSKAKARDAKRVSDLAQIQLNLELFFDRCNEYPTSPLSIDYGCPSLPTIKVSNFISVIPKDNGADYTYVTNADRTDYVVKADLETGSSALLDAPSGTINIGGTPVDCSHSSSPYHYCVQPK